MADQRKLEITLHDLKIKYNTCPSDMLLAEIETVKTSLEAKLTNKAEKSVFFARQRMYEFANKPNKYLANLLRSRSQAQVISSIKDKEGKCHHDNKVINKIFRAFYKRLYSSQSSPSSGDNMNKFFANLNIQESTEEQRQMLNKPIELSEILNCINNLPKGKAPGPDGFTVEFFQKFKMELGSLIHEMIQYSFDSDKLPDSMTEANICVF